ncbi:MAG: single-stranded-DNA-specific exonuclease RecJ [Gammaproteobacteria bacterium]|jgi:single-stranded-DNA-specific exonuclease|nr:single-stranded-DNA-specific exonuclease RecJ [Gammaproteobacteria bacterium]MBT3488379.1 single-stranded-DNA-specific exonuclease RecJ [Gammaproteobacteria bacterium]MBT3719430.1 single-stranded-DNA-specific exonuclease RecJ [Gammaproteobacteria bacterium]MBT3845587.1 single-stranded-DNA-specific exonuclease RecJ [Gammaproteobacteria bacterium]MBT3894117.1 single-stranded-DNA-specific exonuclease RecJ [Gammaproteobacteria bacterium]
MRVVERTVPAGDALPGISPLLDRIYRARGITHNDHLDHSLKRLLPISSLKNVAQAAEIVANSIRDGERIVVVADYDADGATACSVCMRGLGAMGADINYVVPDRKKHGYGLSPQVVDLALEYEPQLLITVDNGISSIEGVAAAKQRGMKVVVTDHHLPGEQLPDADVIVNPNQLGDDFKSPNLAGVGVAFYLVCAVKQVMQHAFNPASLLDLVAVGTVADVVQLDHNNRILVTQGIQRIRQGQCAPGVSALLSVAGREQQRVVATDFGFAVGPRINAAGRMAEMGAGIDCLLSESLVEAQPQAVVLDQINRQRREVEGEMREEAEQIIESLHIDLATVPAGVALYQPHWHEGVVGIVAGRIKEQLHRPTIVFARGEGGVLKGSARSIPGVHIRDLLDLLSKQQGELILKFGGHAMAAGLSIREEDFQRFHDNYQQLVKMSVDSDLLEEVVRIDGGLSTEERTLTVAAELQQAGPWGQGFPEPLFQDSFILDSWRIVGERHLKMVLRDCQSGKSYDAIAFNQSEQSLFERGGMVDLVYKLDVNRWQGRESLQLMVNAITTEAP